MQFRAKRWPQFIVTEWQGGHANGTVLPQRPRPIDQWILGPFCGGSHEIPFCCGIRNIVATGNESQNGGHNGIVAGIMKARTLDQTAGNTLFCSPPALEDRIVSSAVVSAWAECSAKRAPGAFALSFTFLFTTSSILYLLGLCAWLLNLGQMSRL